MNVNADDAAHLTAIASLSGVGPARLRLLLDAWEPGEAWARIRAGTVTTDPLVAHGLGSRRDALVTAWRAQASTLDPFAMVERQHALGIRLLAPGDPGYPRAFVDDIEPPVVLWALGDPAVLRPQVVAIVGTRRCTRYGHDVARRFGAELAAAGVSVVSGLALGIDAAAHSGALDAVDDGAPPVAVVGTGLDVVYPTRNRSLWRSVAERGVLFSEAPPGAAAEPWRFPARNRLIAALADVVVVVESAERGGSLYTVDEAIRRSTDVRAVPGPVNSPVSAGTNRLLADGAGPAISAGEILESLGIDTAQVAESECADPVDPDETAILGALAAGSATLGQLADDVGLTFERLALVTARLEAKGSLARSGGWYERCG